MEKINVFGKHSTFTQSNSARAALEIFKFFFQVLQDKKWLLMKSFTDYPSGNRLPDCSKLNINWKDSNDVTIFGNDVIFKFFWHFLVSLVNFSYWSKFYVNFITGSGVMIVSFYKELTRTTEIGNTTVWVLPNIRLGWVRNTKFDKNVSNKMLLNASKCQRFTHYSFPSD